MKVGKITLDGYNNYGNTLQNYALQEYLKENGCSVETIWHSSNELLNAFWHWGKKEEIKFITNYKNFNIDIKKGIKAWEFARRVRGMDFTQRYINVRYGVSDLHTIANDYDFFIVGSDQVWNPNNPDLSTLFLNFAPPQKRIAFSASIGAQSIPKEKKNIFQQGLNNMHAISVRENRAAELIYELTGKKVDVLLDPVFTVSEDQWRSIAIKPYWMSDEDYIFAYFLGDIPKSVLDLAKRENLEIINCFDKTNIDRYIMSPEEWLFLIGNARYVVTDSFHATAFSIIFKRKFLVFPRTSNNQDKQMITRIESILDTFNLGFCFINDPSKKIEISQNEINCEAIIYKEIKKSDEYLKNALDL